MSNPFVAEIRIFTGGFAPKGWAMCDGQLMSISQNTALFSLLGTTYGGNGTSNFALPGLQGNGPMHFGQGQGLSLRDLGETGGEPAVTLLQTEMPQHTHTVQAMANANGSVMNPANQAWAKHVQIRTQVPLYETSSNTQMSPLATSVVGGSQPHNNLMPYLGLNFIIALQGIFPPRS